MHKFEIPDDVVNACIERRGRLDVFTQLEPKRLALVVIDMQNAWVEPGASPLEIPVTRSILVCIYSNTTMPIVGAMSGPFFL